MTWDGDDDDLPEDLDSPLTHLGDDEYEEFVREQFTGSGAPRGTPPVVRILLAIVLGLLVLAVLALT